MIRSITKNIIEYLSVNCLQCVLAVLQDVIKDAPLYQEKVTYLNEFNSNLVSDPCLGEEERKTVREETAICNENWNDLVNLANAKQAR